MSNRGIENKTQKASFSQIKTGHNSKRMTKTRTRTKMNIKNLLTLIFWNKVWVPLQKLENKTQNIDTRIKNQMIKRNVIKISLSLTPKITKVCPSAKINS